MKNIRPLPPIRNPSVDQAPTYILIVQSPLIRHRTRIPHLPLPHRPLVDTHTTDPHACFDIPTPSSLRRWCERDLSDGGPVAVALRPYVDASGGGGGEAEVESCGLVALAGLGKGDFGDVEGDAALADGEGGASLCDLEGRWAVSGEW